MRLPYLQFSDMLLETHLFFLFGLSEQQKLWQVCSFVMSTIILWPGPYVSQGPLPITIERNLTKKKLA